MFTRRKFLTTSSLVALAPTVPVFLRRAAQAAESRPDEPILVVIQLSGGNDGVNTVVPFADGGYAKHRNVLRLPEDQLHKIGDGLGLHPSMRAAADLLEQQRLAIVQGVGYPNPSRSHAVSMAVWKTASLDRQDHNGYGWIGRALDELPTPRRNAPNSILVADAPTPVVLRGRRCVSSSFGSLDDLMPARDVTPPGASSANEPSAVAGFVRRASLDAYATAETIKDFARVKDGHAASYPASGLARRLKLIAQLVKADLGTRVYYAMQDGYDTHSVQLGRHSRLLGVLSEALKAFLDDLAAAGLEERVLVLCFSEFGRRVAENASAGTDHGTAAPMFLAGGNVCPGVHGRTPSLLDLHDGDLEHTIDFRSIYATVLGRWLDVDPSSVIDGDFAVIDGLLG